MKTRFAVLAALVLAIASVAMALDNPFTGTWKGNLVKSTNRTGNPPKSITNRFDLQQNVLTKVEDMVRADRTVMHREPTAIFDGKDHPVTDNPRVDAYQASRIDSNILIIVLKKRGNKVRTDRLVVSKNGKTMTITRYEKNDQGQEIKYYDVYQKQ